MNNYVFTRAKETISILLIIIAILSFLLIRDYFSIFRLIPRENLVNFVTQANDPYQDFRSVMLIAPDQPKKLAIFQPDLLPITPCHDDDHTVSVNGVRESIDDKCGKNLIQFDDASKDQIIVISTATKKKITDKKNINKNSKPNSFKNEEETYTYVTYLDHLIYTTCPPPSGGQCPNHDHARRHN